MSRISRLFSNWWVLSILTAVVLLVLFVFVAPLVLVIFDPWTVRLALALAIVLVWSGLAAWRVMSARRASGRIERKLGVVSAAAESESEVLARRLREAITSLRAEGGGRGDYLYSRPWYVMIGPPGAGKTTALLNSGLHFPAGGVAERNVGGTRTIDFLFSDEAVLLDTAGRYTSQDSDAGQDRQGWLQLLDLLRTNRPLQPINGVIVAIGVDELASADLQGIERHAKIIDARLRELQEALKIEVPVYALFTKGDLIAGFTEFYGDLDVEGRRAVLGATLPWTGAVPADSDRIAAQFDELVYAVGARTAKRLQDEMDLRKRSLIVGFPMQIAALRPRLLCFMERAFAQRSRRQPVAFRGFYFTSGVQMGTPFDRVLGRVATLYDSPASETSAGKGRAYFINRLLKDVIFAEAGLVRRTPAIVAKERAILLGGGAAMAAICILAIALWTVSYFRNVAWTQSALTQTEAARSELSRDRVNLAVVSANDPDFEQALPVMEQLRGLPGGYADRHGDGHTIWMTFGLYQESLGRLEELTYLDTAQRIVLPRMLLRLAQRMRVGHADQLGLYQTLKAYLMAGGQAPELDRKFLASSVSDDLSTNVYAGSDSAPLRDSIMTHVEAVLDDPQFGQLWQSGIAPLDAGLVGAARSAVESMSLSDQAYAILKQNALRDGGANWHADMVLTAGAAHAFANGDAVVAATVPFLFTKDGYLRAYQIGLATVQRDLQKDLWVLGSDKAKLSTVTSFQAIRQGVGVHYAHDYIEAWNGVLSALTPANYFTNPDALSAALSQPSPIKLMMQEISRNTTFDGKEAAVAGTIARRLMPRAATMFRELPVDLSQPNDAASTINMAFKDLHDYVNGNTSRLDEFLAKLKDATTAMAIDHAAGAADPLAHQQLTVSENALSALPLQAPAVLRPFLTAAAAQGNAASATQAQANIASAYSQTLLPVCQSLTGTYPFLQTSQQDASISDLQPVFGQGSQFDTFIRNQLMSHVNQSSIWRWSETDPVSAGFKPETAAEFQKLLALRDLLTGGVQAKIEAIAFGGGVTAAEFDPGGQVIRFDPTQNGARQFQWTPSAPPQARVMLYSGTQVVQPFDFQGPWAVFRLFDAAKKVANGPFQFAATFGDGSTFVTFRITLIGNAKSNPFNRNALWSFRCPTQL